MAKCNHCNNRDALFLVGGNLESCPRCLADVVNKAACRQDNPEVKVINLAALRQCNAKHLDGEDGPRKI